MVWNIFWNFFLLDHDYARSTWNNWFRFDVKQHVPVDLKLSTKVCPFFGSARNQLLECLPHGNSHEDGYLDSFAEIIYIHAGSLEDPSTSVLEENISKKWALFNMNDLKVPVSEQVKAAVANVVRAFLKSNILWRYGGAALVQEKVIDSITALSYILPHLFNPPFQS